MGLFGKLKNAVTGGAAEVVIEAGEASVNGPFTMKVRATSKGDEVKYKKVYLQFQGYETAKVHEIPVAEGHGVVVQTVEGEFMIQNLDIEVDGSGVLPPNETREWSVEIELPEGSMGTFEGDTIGCYYKAMAGLDTVGNDPDSGWLEVEVAE